MWWREKACHWPDGGFLVPAAALRRAGANAQARGGAGRRSALLRVASPCSSKLSYISGRCSTIGCWVRRPGGCCRAPCSPASVRMHQGAAPALQAAAAPCMAPPLGACRRPSRPTASEAVQHAAGNFPGQRHAARRPVAALPGPLPPAATAAAGLNCPVQTAADPAAAVASVWVFFDCVCALSLLPVQPIVIELGRHPEQRQQRQQRQPWRSMI